MLFNESRCSLSRPMNTWELSDDWLQQQRQGSPNWPASLGGLAVAGKFHKRPRHQPFTGAHGSPLKWAQWE